MREVHGDVADKLQDLYSQIELNQHFSLKNKRNEPNYALDISDEESKGDIKVIDMSSNQNVSQNEAFEKDLPPIKTSMHNLLENDQYQDEDSIQVIDESQDLHNNRAQEGKVLRGELV